MSADSEMHSETQRPHAFAYWVFIVAAAGVGASISLLPRSLSLPFAGLHGVGPGVLVLAIVFAFLAAYYPASTRFQKRPGRNPFVALMMCVAILATAYATIAIIGNLFPVGSYARLFADN